MLKTILSLTTHFLMPPMGVLEFLFSLLSISRGKNLLHTCIVCSSLTHSLSVQVYFALCWQEPNSHLLVCIEWCLVSLLCGSTDPKHCELIDLTNGGHHSGHTTLQTRPNSDSQSNL